MPELLQRNRPGRCPDFHLASALSHEKWPKSASIPVQLSGMIQQNQHVMHPLAKNAQNCLNFGAISGSFSHRFNGINQLRITLLVTMPNI